MPPGWDLQELVRGKTEWSTTMLVDRGTLVMHTTMLSCLERDWGVYPEHAFQRREASEQPNTSSFVKVLGEVHGVPLAVVHRACPTIFRTLRAILNATTVSGIVNANYKVRPDGTPVIYDMNVGRPTGDLVASPDAVLANFLLTYARRAGACPPGTTAQLAEEEAAAAASQRTVFMTESANVESKGVCEVGLHL